MTTDQVFVLACFFVAPPVILWRASTQHAKDLASMADHRRARRSLGRIHEATIQAPPSPRQGSDAMTKTP